MDLYFNFFLSYIKIYGYKILAMKLSTADTYSFVRHLSPLAISKVHYNKVLARNSLKSTQSLTKQTE